MNTKMGKDSKIYNSELRVMDILWKDGDMTASKIAKTLETEVGWNKNTTYTIVKKCVDKGYVERSEPGFMCKAIVGRDKAQKDEISQLIKKFFDNSVDSFLTAFVNRENLDKTQIKKLKDIVNKLD